MGHVIVWNHEHPGRKTEHIWDLEAKVRAEGFTEALQQAVSAQGGAVIPDEGQVKIRFRIRGEKVEVAGASAREAIRAFHERIEGEDVGASQTSDGIAVRAGRRIARVSYNGRLWKPRP